MLHNYNEVIGFYFMIWNINPKYHSKVGSIKLLALVKSSLIAKHGINKMLQPFVNDIKLFESVGC